MEYKKQLFIRFIVSFVILLTGVGAIATGVELRSTAAMVYLIASGAAFVIAGAVRLIQCILLTRDEARQAAALIEEADERNRILAYKASHFALYIVAWACYALALYFAFLNFTVMITLLIVALMLLALRLVFFLFMRFHV